MREIKFRAWDVCGKKMLSVVKINLLTQAVWAHPQFCHKNNPMNIGDHCCILMQYTGLKDKNGKEIYEGDVVKWDHGCDENDQGIDEIVFDCGSFKAGYEGYRIDSFDFNDTQYINVIGNIHENPELLKENKDVL